MLFWRSPFTDGKTETQRDKWLPQSHTATLGQTKIPPNYSHRHTHTHIPSNFLISIFSRLLALPANLFPWPFFWIAPFFVFDSLILTPFEILSTNNSEIEFNHLPVCTLFLLAVGCMAVHMVWVWACVGLWVISVFVSTCECLYERGCVQAWASVCVWKVHEGERLGLPWSGHAPAHSSPHLWTQAQ